MTRVAVVGPTNWGTTLAVLLARGSADVSLIARSVQEMDTLNAARENTRHRPGLRFPDALAVTNDPEAITTADLVVLAVPSASLRANLVRVAPSIAPDASVLSATKGIEADTCLRMSQVIETFGIETRRILALSGPNFAAEIARGLPAATVVACADEKRAEQVQSLLSGPTFRAYTSDDVPGVEIGGALKNVVAIACGMADGLGYGENAKAALITRGLAEISRLGVAAGAKPLTFLGLAGLGDLVLTCESNLSRNRSLGLALAQERSLDEAIEAAAGVVEGVVTARSVPQLARRLGVEMPICEALYAVLFEGKPVVDAVRELMSRESRPERDSERWRR
jgi:glycerol-3-phosphate dehydrogenase (NAD(P)+)